MLRCCGESYTVNEDFGHPNRKQDHSFKAIISFMLGVLLIFVVIYCLIAFSIKSNKHDTANETLKTTSNEFGSDDNYQVATSAIIASSTKPSSVATTSVSPLEESSSLERVTTSYVENIQKPTEARINKSYRPDATYKIKHTTSSHVSNEYTTIEEVLTTNAIIENDRVNRVLFRNDQSTTNKVDTWNGFVKETNRGAEIVDISNITTPQPPLTTTTSTATYTTLAHIDFDHSTTIAYDQKALGTLSVSHDLQRNSIMMTKPNKTRSSYSTSTENDNITRSNHSNISDDMELLPGLHSKNVCEGFQCKEKVGDILQQMDHSIDSCEDFYQFTCGRSNKRDQSSSKIQILEKTLDQPPNNFKAADFHRFVKSCVQYHNGYEYGYEYKIEQVLSNNIRSNNLTVLLASLMARQCTPFFEVKFDFISSSEGYGLQLLPPSDFYNTAILRNWSIQSRLKEYCMNMEHSTQSESDLKTAYENYKSCTEKVVNGKIKDFVFFSRNGSRTAKSTKEVDDFPVNMKRISDIDVEMTVANQRYIKTDIAGLNQMYNSINWSVFFHALFHQKFNHSMPIYLYMQNSYFNVVMTDLKNRLTRNEEDVLHKVKQFYQFQLYENLVTLKPNAKSFCIKQAEDLIPEITESIFGSEFDQTRAIERVKTAFGIMKDKFFRLLSGGIIGIEKSSSEYLIKQLQNLKLSFLESHQNIGKSPIFPPGNDYISYLLVSLDARRCISAQPIKPEITFSQHEYPLAVPNSQIVFVPNNFLYRILKDEKNPAYVNDIYLKFHISRAIAWYLDEAAGHIESSFWNELKESFSSYLEMSEGSRYWNGKQITYNEDQKAWQKVINASLSEVLADNLALQIAFHNFSSYAGVDRLPWIAEEITPEQQFFILIAQDYCQSLTFTEFAQRLYESPNIPNIFRVSTMMSNSKDFEATFKCARGSGMNPEEKIEFNTFKPQEIFGIVNR